MNAVFAILSFQAVVGAFDNLWHHEWQARLPQRVSARKELRLHAAREALYAGLFLALAWSEWHGGWALLLGGVLLAEFGITIADFLEEDRSRRLPPLERALHTALAVSYGAFLALMLPVLQRWWQQPAAIVPVQHGALSWLFTLFAVAVAMWSLRNLRAVGRLQQAVQEAATGPTVALTPRPATLVSGATGFIGSRLVKALVAEGERVVVWARDPVQAQAQFGAGVIVVGGLDELPPELPVRRVVSLAGAPVLGLPWTAARRRLLIASRVNTTAALVQWMRSRPVPPEVLVSASAVGYYGVPAEGEEVDEDAPAQPGRFQSDLCAAVEHEARRAEALGVRVVRLRFGIVLGHGGGAYPQLALAARFGLGAVLGRGTQPMAWIHLQDALGLIHFALAEARLRGPVNAVAPQPVTHAQFTDALARSVRRPRWLRTPGWVLRAALGEMSELLLEGQRVQPRVAREAGYAFRFGSLQAALQDLAARRLS